MRKPLTRENIASALIVAVRDQSETHDRDDEKVIHRFLTEIDRASWIYLTVADYRAACCIFEGSGAAEASETTDEMIARHNSVNARILAEAVDAHEAPVLAATFGADYERVTRELVDDAADVMARQPSLAERRAKLDALRTARDGVYRPRVPDLPEIRVRCEMPARKAEMKP